MNRLALLLLLAVVSTACALPEHVVRRSFNLPDFTAEPGGWRDLQLPMQDGVKLHTRVLMPKGLEHAPVVLMRNPYRNYGALLELECQVYARYGIGCVLQDVRGRLGSEGEWVPLVHEMEDGEETLAWLDAQPWADAIALKGVSYLAATALAPGHHLPPKVKTLVLQVFGVSLRPSVTERGLFHHELLTAWAAYMPGHAQATNTTEHYRAMLRHRPHLEADQEVFGQRLDFYREWVSSPGPDDAMWSSEQTRRFESIPPDIHVPVLHIEGFDDAFLPSGLDTFARLGSREQSLLAIYPMNHTGQQSGDVPVDVDTLGAATWTLAVPWLRHFLQGVPLPFETGVVKTWPRGDTGPVVRKAWPGPTTEQRWVLDGAEVQATPCVQRGLTATAGAEATLRYRYDPGHPWRPQGSARGLAYLVADGERVGPVEQQWECRPDVLRFVTPALTKPTRLLGRMRLNLRVRSSAPDTAFIAKLVDLGPDGRAFHVTDGAATLHWPTDATRTPEAYTPGTERRVELDFFPTEWVLQPGHRVGLWVSSSAAPWFSTHLNTEQPWYQAQVFHVADQAVLVGGAEPSALLLRVE